MAFLSDMISALMVIASLNALLFMLSTVETLIAECVMVFLPARGILPLIQMA